ncbi:MAG: antibiotic resistance protein MarC [Betaproteobacteria bacterium SG8_40]|nr:MAG: antibiotic resistance protein MarC [Betaproteobacteria bacterium SG8_40]
MTETAVVAFATFFATISPLDISAIFAALTVGATARHRRAMAIRATLIATAILLLFAFAGNMLLASIGISLAALRTAGGILLLLIAIEMVFARTSGGTSATDEEKLEAATRQDISVFPLATPLIAGPGAMGATILLMANAHGDLLQQAAVIAAMLAVLTVTAISLLLAGKIQQLLGVTGMHVITRVMGILLSALAVQFIFDGIKQSGILGTL